MLVCPFYNGSGLGNQLANYVTTRCTAIDLGYEFGTAFPERFKGKDFIKIDYGKNLDGLVVPIEGQPPLFMPDGYSYYEEEGEKNTEGVDTRGYDPMIKRLPDNTVIHGLLQGEQYFKHRRNEIKKWLNVEPISVHSEVCFLVFRGGEYRYVSDFYLPAIYWRRAMDRMRLELPYMKFHVLTDDTEAAREMLPDIPRTFGMEFAWRSLRYARYIILSNSTFGWFPTWLNEPNFVIYPKHYGRHNKGYWCLKQNCTEGWTALDKEGQFWSYDECKKEL